MKITVPPIKSQGIKTKLVPWILSQIQSREGRWIEPFMGTGVVGFNAAFNQSLMADLNPHLVAFYEAIRTHAITPEIVEDYLTVEGEALARAGNNGYDHYRLVRTRFNSSKNPNPLDFLFLNRAGFNGMIRFSKNGWNIPFCKKPNRFIGMLKTKIVNQIIRVQNIIRNEWVFSASNFEATIASAGPNDLIYCDPPYHGRHADYYTKWNEQDEKKLVELLKSTKARFILSTWHHNEYRKNAAIDVHWGDYHVVTREHFYHAGAKEKNRKPMVEALVMNYPPFLTAIEDAECDEGEDDESLPRVEPMTRQLELIGLV